MQHKRIWLDHSVFDWYVECHGGSITSYSDLIRAYELWDHAKSLINTNENEFQRSDAISNLKKCLNQRLKFIEYVYSLKKVATKDSPKGYLEYLETFDIVRPLMLKNLMSIRNDIEHNDASPPSLERCMELLDLTWYFLKSTDSYIRIRREDISYSQLTDEGEETRYKFGLDIDYDLDHQFSIMGWFDSSTISLEPIDKWVKVDIENLHTKRDKWPDGVPENHKNKLDTDLWLTGKLEPECEIKHQILRDVMTSEY